MAKAIYHNDNLQTREFEVLKDHGNGTVDIGLGKVVAVSKARVVTEPEAGCVVLVDGAAAVPPAVPPAKSPKDESQGKAKA